MSIPSRPRTWTSTCSDCRHCADDACTAGEPSSGPKDFYAAICRRYLGRPILPEQNYIFDPYNLMCNNGSAAPRTPSDSEKE